MKYIEEGRKMKDKIIVKGARVHNLKNVSLEIPRDKLIVLLDYQVQVNLL